jgi:hypothetical protein
MKEERTHGHSWLQIAQFLPGRSANAIKNRWNYLSRRRMRNLSLPFPVLKPGTAPPAAELLDTPVHREVEIQAITVQDDPPFDDDGKCDDDSFYQCLRWASSF